MQLPPEQKPTIGYVVSTWSQLSQTFVSNEILALERSRPKLLSNLRMIRRIAEEEE